MTALYSISAFKAAYALAQLLPRAAARGIADGLAAWVLRSSPHLRKITLDNLSVATALNGVKLDALVRENIRCFSRMLADYFLCAGIHASRVPGLIEGTEGWDHLAAAREAGRGTILVTGHLGHWELGGVLLALRRVPLTVVTLPEPSDALTRWRGECRKQLGIGTIEVGPGRDFAILEMLRTLRGNGVLAMLVDRPYPGTAISVDQFGRRAQYSNAAAILAHHTGATVLPVTVLRQRNHRYRAVTYPPVPMTAGPLREVLDENTQRIASVFEVLIRSNPDQWFNYVPLFQTP